MMTDEQKRSFDNWEKLFKKLIEILFEIDYKNKTYKLKADQGISDGIKQISSEKIIQYISESIKNGKGMSVFAFLIAFNKVYKKRNKIVEAILGRKIEEQWYGIPAGQTGIQVKYLQKNSQDEKYNKIAYLLINECNSIKINKNIEVNGFSFKLDSPIYKNIFYLLCPQRFYSSDRNTQKLLKNKEPLLMESPKDKYHTRNESFKAYNIEGKDETKGKLMQDIDYIDLLTSQSQIILQGPPGTGKTRLAKIIAINMLNKDNQISDDASDGDIKKAFDELGEKAKLIQFHPSYSYEDFVRGITAKIEKGKTGINYVVENKVLAQMAKDAFNDKEPYILIIDEINRANLSSVLGELIYALEYRDEAVESMYELEYRDDAVDGKIKKTREIILPSNLYIIGTMNTADRSVGHIDYAIRRRFTFVDVLPNGEIEGVNPIFEEVKALFVKEDSRAEYLSLEFNPYDVMPGHSYFLGNNIKQKLEYQVIPLLKEYVKDGVLNERAEQVINELESKAKN